MTDSQEQRAFTKDIIDSGYKKFKSEEEDQILRKHNLSRDESLSNDKYIKIILVGKHMCYILVQKILIQILQLI
jgi:hypothetical protein